MRVLTPSLETDLSVVASVVGYRALRATPEQIAHLRRNPGPAPKHPIPPGIFKLADEQTVVGVAAVLQVVAESLPDEDFSQWGVISAPVYLGRIVTHQAVQRYVAEGAWGISPQLIPQHSLHAPSGTVSQLLKIHGPNFGVGNAPGAAEEAFLLAATMLSENLLPGLWLVLTMHETEHLPQNPPETCLALALAFKPVPSGEGLLHLRICPRDPDHADFLAALPEFSLTQLVEEVSRPDTTPAGMWRLGASGWVELEARTEEMDS